MDDRLIRYATGDLIPSRANREVAQRAKGVFDEIQLAALKSDGAMALAAHAMEGMALLDHKRELLAQGDAWKNTMLSRLEARALMQVEGIQEGLYGFGGQS